MRSRLAIWNMVKALESGETCHCREVFHHYGAANASGRGCPRQLPAHTYSCAV